MHWKFSSDSYIKSHSDRVCFNKLCINSTLKSITMLYHISEYYNGDEDGILRGSQIVVPTALQDRVLEMCHEAHLGIAKSKQQQSAVYGDRQEDGS